MEELTFVIHMLQCCCVIWRVEDNLLQKEKIIETFWNCAL